MGKNFIIALLLAVLVLPLCAKAYAGTQHDAGNIQGLQFGYQSINTAMGQATVFEDITASKPCKYCCKMPAIVNSQVLTVTRLKATRSTPPLRAIWPMADIAAAYVSPNPPPVNLRPHSYRAMLAVSSRLLI